MSDAKRLIEEKARGKDAAAIVAESKARRAIRTETQLPNPDTISALNHVVANLTVLNQKLRHFHWNVVGENFFDIHEFFGTIYDQLVEHIDQFAERVRQLKGTPVHTLKDMIDLAIVSETSDTPSDMAMCKEILEDFDKVISSLGVVVDMSAKRGDRPTTYLVDTVVGCYEKHQWFLRSFMGAK